MTPGRLPAPSYDCAAVTTGIVHIGPGAFHRSHQAMYVDRLLSAGSSFEWGITGVGLRPDDRPVGVALRRQDHVYTLMLKHPDGRLDARRIGALREHLYAPDAPALVLERLVDPAVRIVSLTVTEGGYNVDETTGAFDVSEPQVAADLRPGAVPRTVFGYVVEGLRLRGELGFAPYTVVSCDNVEGNGSVAREAFSAFASAVDPDLGSWVRDHVSFPSSMVDRITPATTDADRVLARQLWGIDDEIPVVAEPFVQWVLEDEFGAGRPPLEEAGVQVVADVRPYELMKLRLLNGSHQAMAYFGTLLGYTYVAEAAADPLIVRLLVEYMDEAAGTLDPIDGADLTGYRDSLLQRFANPHISDTLARLCAFGSDRIPRFVLPVVRDGLAAASPVATCAAVVASWAHYLRAVDDSGRRLDVVDRRRDELEPGAALLHHRGVFGDLGQQPHFAEPFRAALGGLEREGVRPTLARLLPER